MKIKAAQSRIRRLEKELEELKNQNTRLTYRLASANALRPNVMKLVAKKYLRPEDFSESELVRNAPDVRRRQIEKELAANLMEQILAHQLIQFSIQEADSLRASYGIREEMEGRLDVCVPAVRVTCAPQEQPEAQVPPELGEQLAMEISFMKGGAGDE